MNSNPAIADVNIMFSLKSLKQLVMNSEHYSRNSCVCKWKRNRRIPSGPGVRHLIHPPDKFKMQERKPLDNHR
jgi:hypothetical protein